ncbi:MAG: PA14 domain-containing protein [Sneathiella sp.]|uniref:PA14 domain-containing protein n=1 Tax=Sneathiella sp. TaxID=1964365 RepID=UPI003002C8D1
MSFILSICKVATTLSVVAMLVGCASVEVTKPSAEIARTSPQPSTLASGLAVRYYGGQYANIRGLVEMMEYQKGVQGIPLPMLNYKVGEGTVLTTTTTDLMGADITGYINMSKKGRYTFLVQSNDGVRLNIGGKQIFEDPDIHGDRFSPELYVDVTDPGWYSIRVLYFEKSNSSTLELYWQEPEGDMVFVPTEAFGHIKK